MGKKKALARKAAAELAATDAAATLAASRRFRRHYFGAAATPQLRTRLQRAIYSGCTGKVRFLTSIHRNPYTPTAARQSPLFLAIARDQPAIAEHLLQLLDGGPLFGLRYYFEHLNPQPHWPAEFWLRQRILLAYGRDAGEHVRQLAAGMQVPDGELVPVAAAAGLQLVVLQRCTQSAGEVLWLRPRTRADGRRLARIVERCFTDGVDDAAGDLELGRRDWHGQGWFEAAVEMRLTDIWWRMYEMFGRVVLPLVNVLSQLCQLSDSVPELECALQRAGIDLRASMQADPMLGAELWSWAPHWRQFEIVEYILRLVLETSKVVCDTESNEADAAHRTRLVDELLSSMLCGRGDHALQRRCLADLGADPSALVQTKWHWFVKGRAYDERIGGLIVGLEERWTAELMCALVQNNWLPTVRAIFQQGKGAVLFEENPEQALGSLCECLDRQHDEMLIYVLGQFENESSTVVTAAHRRRLFRHLLVTREFGDVPVALQEAVLTPAISGNGAVLGELMFVALECWRVRSFADLWRRAKEIGLDVGDIRNADDSNLLAAAIFERCRFDWHLRDQFHKQQARQPRADTADEALELSESDDEDEEHDRKLAWNRERDWRLRESAAVAVATTASESPEAAMRLVFDQLVAAGCDVRHVNANGETLLHCAIARDNRDIVQYLLHTAGVQRTATVLNDTALHFVRSVDVLELLLPPGNADVAPLLHARNDAGQTPLHCALQGGQRLASQKTTPDTDIQFACMRRSSDEAALARWMLAAGADVNARDAGASTPLLGASVTAAVWTAVCETAPALDLLVRNAAGETLLQRLAHGWYHGQADTPALCDLVNGDERFAELFRRHGAELDHERLVAGPYQFNELCRLRCAQITARGFWRREQLAGRLGRLALEAYAYEMPDTWEAVRVVARLLVAGVNYWEAPPEEEGDERAEEWSSPLEGTMFECLLAIEGDDDDDEEEAGRAR